MHSSRGYVSTRTSSGVANEASIAGRQPEWLVEAAAANHLYQHVVTAALTNIALAVFVATALSLEGPTLALYIWASALVLVSLGRIFLAGAYRRTLHPEPARWMARYVGLSAATGLLWGGAVALFALRVDPVAQLLLLMVVAGMSAGSLPVNAALLSNYYLYLAGTLLPIVATYSWYGLFGDGTVQHVTIALAVALYAASMVVMGRTHNREQRKVWEITAQLDRANRELQRRASHDALTGLWNRQRLEFALDDEFDRSERYGGEFSLVMVDIDHFKSVNDTHGHEVGDRVLQELAKRLRASLRRADRAARWGGEEFMVLLPHTSTQAAFELAERLRAHVAETPFDPVGRITISAGVAGFVAGEERTLLLKRVDRALYMAKDAGRNCVRSAEAGGSRPGNMNGS